MVKLIISESTSISCSVTNNKIQYLQMLEIADNITEVQLKLIHVCSESFQMKYLHSLFFISSAVKKWLTHFESRTLLLSLTLSYARYWSSITCNFWSTSISYCDQDKSICKHFLVAADLADKWSDRISQLLHSSKKLSKLWLVAHRS